MFNVLINSFNISYFFIILPLIGFILTSAACILDRRLQNYIELFSGIYMSYFVLLWIYSALTAATDSPIFGINIAGNTVKLTLYTSGAMGMVIGALAVRYEIYLKFYSKIDNLR